MKNKHITVRRNNKRVISHDIKWVAAKLFDWFDRQCTS